MPTYLLPEKIEEDEEFLLYNEVDEVAENALNILTGNYRGPAQESNFAAERFTKQVPTEGNISLDILQGRKPGASLDAKSKVVTKIPKSFRAVDDAIQERLRYLSAGAIEGVANIIEAPEKVYNAYVDGVESGGVPLQERAFFSDPVQGKVPRNVIHGDAKIEALSFISNKLRTHGSTYVEGPPKELSHKLMYLTGYLVPDLAAAITAGQVAQFIAKSVGFFSQTLARIVGVTSYGAATGGIEKARDFAVLDILSLPFQRYSKPVKAIAMSILMSEYTSITNDPRSPHYDPDAPLIGAIMGFAFGLMGPSGKRSFSQDFSKTSQMFKNWFTKQKAQGKDTRPNAYVQDFMNLHEDISMRAMNADHRVLDPVGEVQQWIRNVTGEPTKATGVELRNQLQDIFMLSPGSEPLPAQKAYDIASKTMMLTDEIQARNIKFYKGLVGKKAEKPETVEELIPIKVDGQTVYRTQEGVDNITALEVKRIARERIEGQVETKKGKIVVRGTNQNVAIANRNKTIAGIHEDLTRLTIAPEGFWMNEIQKYPGHYARVRDLFNMQYTSSDIAGVYMDEALEVTGFNDMTDRYQKYYERYVSSQRDYDVFRRKKDQFMEDNWLSMTDVITEMNLIEDIIRAEQGDVGWKVFKDRVDGYFEAEHLQLRRLVDEGIESEATYAKMENEHYATSKLIQKVETDTLFAELGVFDTSVSGTTPIKKLIKPHGGFNSENVMLLLQRSIATTSASINKNKFLRSMHLLAKEHPENPVALDLKFPYSRLSSDGTWKSIDKKEFDNINEILERKAEERRLAREHKKNTIIQESPEVIDVNTVKVMTKKKAKLEKKRKELMELTETRWAELQKTPAEREVDAQIRPTRTDFNRDNPQIEEIIYDINELQEHINIEADIVDSLNYELEKGLRVRREDPTLPEGWEVVEYRWNSKWEMFGVPSDVAPLLNIRGEGGKSFRDSRTRFITRILTGVPVQKALSVALNSVFGPKSIPRDLNYFGMNDSMVTSLLEYNTITYAMIPKMLTEVTTKGPFYTAYRKAGGFGGESSTLSGIAMSGIGGRRTHDQIRSYRTNDSVIKQSYQDAVRVMGYLNTISETAVRLTHAKYLMDYHGFPLEQAVSRVNRLLNFKRKGPLAAVIGDFYSFAEARGQVLDGFWQALKGDFKKIQNLKNDGFVPRDVEFFKDADGAYTTNKAGEGWFILKMAEYALARAGVIAVAYSIAHKYMSELPVDFRINNWLIPIKGLEVTDENGQLLQGAVRWSNEVNPITAIMDSLIYRLHDYKYGYDTPEIGQEYFTAWTNSLSPADIGSLPPNFKALLALVYNVDPHDYTTIWENMKTGVPKDWARRNTNAIAKEFSDLLHALPIPAMRNVSPAAAAELASIYALQNNLSTGFLGSLFSTESLTANQSTVRAVYEFGGPLFRSIIHWERSSATRKRLERISQAATTPATLTIHNKTQDLFLQIKQGTITNDQAFTVLETMDNEGVNYFDREAGLAALKRKVKGWELWKEMLSLYPDAGRMLPKFSDLTYAASLPERGRVAVYEYMRKSLSAKNQAALDYVAPGFGMATPRFQGRLELRREIEKFDKEQQK